MPRFSVVSLSKCCLLLVSVILMLTAPGLAQVIPQGITQWSTQIQAGPVLVDMATGTMVLHIPIRSKTGAIPFTYEILSDINTEGYVNSSNGFLGVVTSIHSGVGHPNPVNCGVPPNTSKQYGSTPGINQWYISDGTGSRHYFQIPDGIQVGPARQGCVDDWGPYTVASSDGSGYTAIIAGSQSLTGNLTLSVYNKDGALVSSTIPALITDADGNTMSTTSGGAGDITWNDTLALPVVHWLYGGSLPNGGHGPNPDTYSYTDVNGSNQTFTIAYSPLHIKTVFGCNGNYDIDKTGVYLPTSVTLPTGAQYVITYEATPGFTGDVTGRLGKITLPTGGYFSFAYSGGWGGGINGFECNYQTIPTFQVSANDNNGHTSTSTYSHTLGSPITETDSLGNVTTHYFNGGEVEAQTVISDVHLGQQRKTITCYNGNFTSCAASSVSALVPLSQTDVYTYPGTSTSPSLVETRRDIYGNPTQISRWDFGATFPPTGSPVSKTTYTYDTASGPCGNLSNPYIVNRPCSITTVNSSGTTVSQTNYTYNTSGHPIQTSQWVSGTTYLNSSASYNSNGTLHTTTDPNGNVTTTNYDGSCNSILPTSTTLPTVNGVTITTSQTWDCNGGVKTSSTDGNGNQTMYSYASAGVADPLWRASEQKIRT